MALKDVNAYPVLTQKTFGALYIIHAINHLHQERSLHCHSVLFCLYWCLYGLPMHTLLSVLYCKYIKYNKISHIL